MPIVSEKHYGRELWAGGLTCNHSKSYLTYYDCWAASPLTVAHSRECRSTTMHAVTVHLFSKNGVKQAARRHHITSSLFVNHLWKLIRNVNRFSEEEQIRRISKCIITDFLGFIDTCSIGGVSKTRWLIHGFTTTWFAGLWLHCCTSQCQNEMKMLPPNATNADLWGSTITLNADYRVKSSHEEETYCLLTNCQMPSEKQPTADHSSEGTTHVKKLLLYLHLPITRCEKIYNFSFFNRRRISTISGQKYGVQRTIFLMRVPFCRVLVICVHPGEAGRWEPGEAFLECAAHTTWISLYLSPYVVRLVSTGRSGLWQVSD